MQEWEWPGSAGGARRSWECRSGSGLVVRRCSKGRVCWRSMYINSYVHHEIKKVFPPTGTVLGNRKGLPPLFKSKQREQHGTIKSFRSGNMLALSWYDKRRVLMLSTKHTNKIVTTTSRYVLYYKKKESSGKYWKLMFICLAI